MLRALGAAGLLLRRFRSERGIMALIFILVAATSFLFAAAPRVFDRATDEALRHTARLAPATQRNLVLRLDDVIAPGSGGGVSGVRAYGDRLATQIPPSVASLFDTHLLQITTVRFRVEDPPAYQTHLSLRYQDGIAEATRLVDGRWPVDRGMPLLAIDRFDPEASPDPDAGPPETVVVEAAMARSVAAELKIELGDRLDVILDRSDSFFRFSPFQLGPTVVEIAGLYEPIDPEASYWAGDAGLIRVDQRGTDERPVGYATAFFSPEAYPNLFEGQMPFHYVWRFDVDPERLDGSRVAQLLADLPRVGRIAGPTSSTDSPFGPPAQVQVQMGMGGILDRYATERALSESVLSVAAIGPFGLATGAMAMVAVLLVRRRAGALALARGRGASGSLVLGTQLWEAVLVGGGAALAGLALALLLVTSRANPLSPALAMAVGGAAILLLVGATWSAARRPLSLDHREDPPGLRASPRRLVIEATIVGLAVAATLLLRQRGLTIDEQPGGGDAVAQFDPLLAAVPVLGGLAAGIVAIRIYPLPLRALAWLSARRRDLVPVLGLRTIGRRGSTNLPILALMLTAAFGAFASVIASSLDHGQVDASYLEVGADYRVERVGIGALDPGLDPASIPGVEAVAPGVVQSAGFAVRVGQRASIYLSAIDLEAYAAVVAGTAAEPAWPFPMTARPPAAGAGTTDVPIPAILSQRLPAATRQLAPGDTFQATLDGRPLTFIVVEQREGFPGIRDGLPFTLVPLEWVRAALGDVEVAPTTYWLRASGDAAASLEQATEAVGATRVVSRYEAYAHVHEAPLVVVVVAGYALAVVVASLYLALTIVGALILSSARRTQDLAYLRTLGVSARQTLVLTVVEHGFPAMLAFLPGVALGVGIAILCEPSLGLATFIGTSDIVPLFVDISALAILVVGLTGVVAVAVTAGTWLSRRARLVNALRMADD